MENIEMKPIESEERIKKILSGDIQKKRAELCRFFAK